MIFTLFIKYIICDYCINLYFNTINKNFPINETIFPTVGSKFVAIHDSINDDHYIDCIVIAIKNMEFYQDENIKMSKMVFAFKYSRYEYDGELIEIDGEQCFDINEFNKMDVGRKIKVIKIVFGWIIL